MSSSVAQTFRNKSILDQYELDCVEVHERIVGEIPIEAVAWNVGVIYGASGTGKSTIASRMFGDSYIRAFEYGDGSVLDEMPESCSVEEISSMFNSVGFATVWSWLKPYHVLSTGEKMRVDLARAILSDMDTVVFDEYTSVVNREVARFGSYAVQKAVRKRGTRFVAVSCHSDVVEWLEPDWVFCTDTMTFEYVRGRLQRAPIEIRIEQVHHSAWKLFQRYHYMNAKLNTSAECYVASYNEVPIAFFAVLHFVHPSHKKTKRGHRLVVLPDYQGCGIGHALSTHIAQRYTDSGFRFIINSGTKSLYHQRAKDPRWIVKSVQRASSGSDSSSSSGLAGSRSSKRYTYSYEYIGVRHAA